MSGVGLESRLQRCKPLLGTFVEIALEAGGRETQRSLMAWTEKAYAEIARIQGVLSFHSEDSELSSFNRWALCNEGGFFKASDTFLEVLTLAIELHAVTQGYFDVCIAPALVADRQLPNHLALEPGVCGRSNDISITPRGLAVAKPLCIDLGGIAKGYAVDCAMAVMPEDSSVIINAGGDLRMSHWESEAIGLRYGKRARATRPFLMQGPAVATSGNYHREGRHAIVCPISGKPRKQAGSVSVFASETMLVDALSKAVWLLPETQTRQCLDRYDAKAVSINRFGLVKKYGF